MRISLLQRSGRQGTLLAVLAFVALTAILLTAGCGGHSSAATPTPTPTATPTPTGTPTPSPTPTPALTAAQVRIGDAPADRVIDFEVTFGSPVVVTLSNGLSASLTLQNNRWELSHMAAKLEPLSAEGFPQGNITSIQVPLENPKVTYVDNTGAQHTFSGTPSQTITVNLNPPLVIGSTPTIVTLDINVASTLTFDPGGNVTAITFSGSTFTFGTKAIGATEAEQQDDSGEIEGVTGKVTLVNGNNFEVEAGQGSAVLTFATDATTKFDGTLTLGTLLNQIVKVEGFTKPDATVFAKEVEPLADSSGAELEGIITSIPNSTSLTLLIQDGIGNGMDPTKVGKSVTVDLTGFSNYKVDVGKCDMTGIGSGNTGNGNFGGQFMTAGQRIEVELKDGVPAPDGTTSVPTQIKLEQQAVNGTVSGLPANYAGGPVQFTLTLPVDSYLAVLSKVPSVTVFLQAGTDVRLAATMKNGDTVRVRGLLYFAPGTPSNVLGMVARRITAP